MASAIKLPKKFKLWRVIYDRGSLSNLSLDEIRDKLKTNMFTPIDNDPFTNSSSGVVSLIDIDESIEENDVAYGEWIMFNWREDNRIADKKTVKRLLKKAIKRELEGAQFISRDRKKELQEQITAELQQKAEPTPKVTPIYIHLASDSIFYPVSSEKKLEAIAEKIEGIFDTGRGEEYLDDAELDMNAWLDYLWQATVSGELGAKYGITFDPKIVGNEESKTTSDDMRDLAFGKLNMKNVLSGTLTRLEQADVELALNPRQLSITLTMPGMAAKAEPDLWGEEYAARLDAVKEEFDNIEKLVRQPIPSSDDPDTVYRTIVDNVLA